MFVNAKCNFSAIAPRESVYSATASTCINKKGFLCRLSLFLPPCFPFLGSCPFWKRAVSSSSSSFVIALVEVGSKKTPGEREIVGKKSKGNSSAAVAWLLREKRRKIENLGVL